MKCKKCGQEVSEIYADGLCCCCIMAGQEEAIKENPEYYGGS